MTHDRKTKPDSVAFAPLHGGWDNLRERKLLDEPPRNFCCLRTTWISQWLARSPYQYYELQIHSSTVREPFAAPHFAGAERVRRCTDVILERRRDLRPFDRPSSPLTPYAMDIHIVHRSDAVAQLLVRNPKVQLLFQPVYYPWINRIERLWNAMRDTVTRNHGCRAPHGPCQDVKRFFQVVQSFPGSGHGVAEFGSAI